MVQTSTLVASYTVQQHLRCLAVPLVENAASHCSALRQAPRNHTPASTALRCHTSLVMCGSCIVLRPPRANDVARRHSRRAQHVEQDGGPDVHHVLAEVPAIRRPLLPAAPEGAVVRVVARQGQVEDGQHPYVPAGLSARLEELGDPLAVPAHRCRPLPVLLTWRISCASQR